jgi:hypothetical protein
MRRPVIMTASILLVACVALLIAAQMMLKPFHQDAGLAAELTRLLEREQALAAGTKVRLMGGRKASADTLAQEGLGVVVELVPSDAVKGRRGGLEGVARRTVEAILERYRDRRVDWIELKFRLSGPDGDPFRTLVLAAAGGHVAPPNPPLPAPMS